MLWPSAVLDRLRTSRSVRPGLYAVLGAAGLWAALCLQLFAGGHAPSVALVPIEREHYYALQAVFVGPLLLVQWGVCSAVALKLARALGGNGPAIATANALAVALALPLSALLLVPDLIAYGRSGFGALAPLVRITAPLTLLASIALASDALCALHALPWRKALLAGGAAVLVQGALGGVLLR